MDTKLIYLGTAIRANGELLIKEVKCFWKLILSV